MIRLLLLLALIALARPATAAFRVDDDGASLHVFEDDAPVVVYRYGQVAPPEGVEARYRRAGYFHPVYDLEGHVISEDFPGDHYHHRGLFWAWPEATVGDRAIDVWLLDGVRPRVVQATVASSTPDGVTLNLENIWSFDDAPEVAVVREKVVAVIHPCTKKQRAIDLELTFTNASEEVFTLRGSQAAIAGDDPTPKGYGGLCFRPRAEDKPFTFAGIHGTVAEDLLELDSPWADVSFSPQQDGKLSGVAIVQHPDNPGYPHEGWIFRHYAFLGASWPHRETYPLQPGQSVTLRYRLIVHSGGAEDAGIPEAARAYAAPAK